MAGASFFFCAGKLRFDRNFLILLKHPTENDKAYSVQCQDRPI